MGIIVLLGLIFGIGGLIWAVFNTNFLDTLVIFLVAGELPGTDTNLSPDQMLIGEAVILGLLAVWFVATLLPKRRPKQKIAVATTKSERIAADVAEQTLKTAKDGLQPKRRQRLWLPQIAIAGMVTLIITRYIAKSGRGLAPTRASIKPALHPFMLIVGAAWSVLFAFGHSITSSLVKYIHHFAAAGATSITKNGRATKRHAIAHTNRVYRAGKPHTQRAWTNFKREYNYSMIGTKVAVQGWLTGLMNSLPATRFAKARDQISTAIRNFLV